MHVEKRPPYSARGSELAVIEFDGACIHSLTYNPRLETWLNKIPKVRRRFSHFFAFVCVYSHAISMKFVHLVIKAFLPCWITVVSFRRWKTTSTLVNVWSECSYRLWKFLFHTDVCLQILSDYLWHVYVPQFWETCEFDKEALFRFASTTNVITSNPIQNWFIWRKKLIRQAQTLFIRMFEDWIFHGLSNNTCQVILIFDN